MSSFANGGMVGFLEIFLAGLLGGFAPLSLKFIRRFAYEHWGLVSSLVGFLIVPWTMLFFICPDVPGALRAIPLRAFLVGNALSAAWGVANILYCICLVRIGFSLTHGILSGIAIPAGVITPMILKGSGVFADAPGPFSRSGLVILLGVAMMLAAVVLVSKAGFGRENAAGGGNQGKRRGGTFLAGLAMCVIAGLASIGISFSFVYTQEAIGAAFVAHGTEAGKASAAVRVVTLLGGALVNVLYPVFLLFHNRSWGVFVADGGRREILLAIPFGAIIIVSMVMTSVGMALLGALGPSIGFGVNQAMQIVGSQSVGFLFGEWHGVPRRYIRTMAVAIALLLAAVAVIAYGNAVG